MAMLSNASAMSDVEFDYGNGRKPALIRTGSKSSNGTDAMSIMSAGPMVAAVGDNDEDDAQPPPPPPPPPPSVVMATATASSARIDVSQEAAQRIVAVLLQLVMGNAAYVYLLLAARDGRFAMSPTALKAAAVTVVPSPPPPPPPSSKEEEKEEEKLQQEKEEEEEEEGCRKNVMTKMKHSLVGETHKSNPQPDPKVNLGGNIVVRTSMNSK
mmetsp:Transcript_25056/g.41913  ORF Transcript_25056/g.41913 Transcript_25056/m.41913 type:complete len:212 (+) Transcript_25056:437-1072(+)